MHNLINTCYLPTGRCGLRTLILKEKKEIDNNHMVTESPFSIALFFHQKEADKLF